MQNSDSSFTRADFHYDLPQHLIAQHPCARRDDSRLLLVDAEEETGVRHLKFPDLPSLLQPGDLLVVNDTRVLNARLLGRKETGGAAEILLERVLGEFEALCQVRVSKRLKVGGELRCGDVTLTAQGREGQFYRLLFSAPVLQVLETLGSVPLPPYIDRGVDTDDAERYQTIWSRTPGAVAAPTAGLHFTPELLETLDEAGVRRTAVTLHIGAGTFQPVRVDDLASHEMHREQYRIEPDCVAAIRETRAAGGRVVAVGTTVVRALESAAARGALEAGDGETGLFITPGYEFQVVDALVTNFHLPESTLLMLVTAFGGYHPVMAAYRQAVAARYRFFSYGDAMFLSRAVTAAGAAAVLKES